MQNAWNAKPPGLHSLTLKIAVASIGELVTATQNVSFDLPSIFKGHVPSEFPWTQKIL